jgi:metal-responsive CopG/Arc/MetJ family transcriptional regulator
MVRPREIKGSPKQVNLNLETTLYEEFEKLLPRKKSVSEAIREYMQETVEESKKVEALGRLPILTSNVRQTSINEYTINYINILVATPDEVIEESLKTLSTEKTNVIYEKLGSIRHVLLAMDYDKK